jgi:hypothetical protein
MMGFTRWGGGGLCGWNNTNNKERHPAQVRSQEMKMILQ